MPAGITSGKCKTLVAIGVEVARFSARSLDIVTSVLSGCSIKIPDSSSRYELDDYRAENGKFQGLLAPQEVLLYEPPPHITSHKRQYRPALR